MVKSGVSLVSAVMVTYDNSSWLEKSINSLLEQSYFPMEIVVVDNASIGEASQLLRARFPKVKVLMLSQNRGFGAGVNAGVREAKGKYIFITNEDMIFDKDCIRHLVAALDKDATLAACQGTTYQYQAQNAEPMAGKQSAAVNTHEPEIQSTGLFFNYSGILTGDCGASRKRGDGRREIFAATVPLMLRRDVFERLGGFDEDFFLYFEEVDLCWRIWLSGKRVEYIPIAKAYHKGGVSTGKLATEFILEHSLRNRIQSYIKNLGILDLILALACQLLIATGGWLLLVLKRQLKLSWAICKAWLWNIYQIGKVSAKRKTVQRVRVMTDVELIQRVGGPLPFRKLWFLSGVGRKA